MKTRTPIHPVVIRRKSYLLPLVIIAAKKTKEFLNRSAGQKARRAKLKEKEIEANRHA